MKHKVLKGTGKRFCCMFLAIAMLLNLCSVEAVATEETVMLPNTLQEIMEDTGNEEEAASSSDERISQKTEETADLQVLGEVPEHRTRFSKEFKMSNGLHMTSVYAEAVHYEKDGVWEEIDNTLRLHARTSGNVYTNTAGDW